MRMVLLGVWIIAVTIAAAFSSKFLRPLATETLAVSPEDLEVESLQTEMTSVPVMRGGEVKGYLIIQFVFEIDREVLAARQLEPTPFLKDAAFRVIFASTDMDFRRPRPDDLEHLTQRIAAEANRRLGGEMVRHVLIEQLNYVRKEDIRTNWIGGQTSRN